MCASYIIYTHMCVGMWDSAYISGWLLTCSSLFKDFSDVFDNVTLSYLSS